MVIQNLSAFDSMYQLNKTSFLPLLFIILF